MMYHARNCPQCGTISHQIVGVAVLATEQPEWTRKARNAWLCDNQYCRAVWEPAPRPEQEERKNG